jgi:Serine dehydrogenase proteinase
VTERYILVIYQGHPPPPLDDLNADVVAMLRRDFEDLITAPREDVEIDLWLESPGGDAHAAYKLALLIRAFASTVRVIIPDYAKSAATLLTIAADEIYMSHAAELGPLDAQISSEHGAVVSTISALDIARSLDDLSSFALNLALMGGLEVLRRTRLSRRESLGATFGFAADFMRPIVEKLEPTAIHSSLTLLDVAEKYAERLLEQRNIERPADVSRLPQALVQNYPTHSFVIGREEAERLGLPVKPLSEYEFAAPACGLHRRFEADGVNIVRLLDVKELQSQASGEDDGRDEENPGEDKGSDPSVDGPSEAGDSEASEPVEQAGPRVSRANSRGVGNRGARGQVNQPGEDPASA